MVNRKLRRREFAISRSEVVFLTGVKEEDAFFFLGAIEPS